MCANSFWPVTTTGSVVLGGRQVSTERTKVVGEDEVLDRFGGHWILSFSTAVRVVKRSMAA